VDQELAADGCDAEMLFISVSKAKLLLMEIVRQKGAKSIVHTLPFEKQ